MADFKDDDFYIVHYLDDTKKMVFNAAGLAAGQVATLNIPDPGAGVSYTGTLALLEVSQNWSGIPNFAAASEPCATFSSGIRIGSASNPAGAAFQIFGDSGHYYQIETNALATYPLADRTQFLADASGTFVMWAGANDSEQPAAGTMLYGAGASLPLSGLAIGAANTVCTSTGSAPQWVTPASIVDAARAWATLQTFRDTTFKLTDEADTSKTAVFSLGGASANADLTIAWAGTVDATVTLPTTGQIAGVATPHIISGAWEFDCVSAVPRFTTDLSGGAGTSAAFEVQDNFSGLKARFFANTAWGGDVNITLPGLTGTLVVATSATATRVPFWSGGALTTDADLTFSGSTLTATNLVITTALTTVGGTAPVANGTYTVGARLTPGGVDGTITTKSGIITAVTQAT